MDQATLVDGLIQDGRYLVERLAAAGIAVTAAGWIREAESGQWFLYLVTPLVGEDGATLPAYRRVNAVRRDINAEFQWLGLSDVKVIGPSKPLARAIVDLARRSPGAVPIRFGTLNLGGVSAEGAYIYPLPVTATAE